MNKKPLFSVIIPALNEEKFLPRLLSSLAAQTKRNFEVIVVDGKSKDATVSVAKSFSKKLPSIRVVVSSKRSVPYQRNFGVQYAHGDWFVFVDADGEFSPYFIERCTIFIESQNPTVFSTWFLPDGTVAADALLTLLSTMTLEMSLVVKRQIAPGPLSIVSRTAYDSVGGYNEEHSFGEDFDFGLRLAKAGYTLSILREALCLFSLRRFRNEGTLKVIQQYAKGAFFGLVTKNAPKTMPGYIMGGQLYKTKKPVKRSVLKMYEKKLRQLTSELFS
jgi:glycosyltransferase involved in cell wall biosynthesis